MQIWDFILENRIFVSEKYLKTMITPSFRICNSEAVSMSICNAKKEK